MNAASLIATIIFIILAAFVVTLVVAPAIIFAKLTIVEALLFTIASILGAGLIKWVGDTRSD